MAGSPSERLARIEEGLSGVRREVAALATEVERNRKRLHDLEGIAQVWTDLQRSSRKQEEAQYRRLELRLQILTVVVAITAVIIPVVLALATRK